MLPGASPVLHALPGPPKAPPLALLRTSSMPSGSWARLRPLAQPLRLLWRLLMLAGVLLMVSCIAPLSGADEWGREPPTVIDPV